MIDGSRDLKEIAAERYSEIEVPGACFILLWLEVVLTQEVRAGGTRERGTVCVACPPIHPTNPIRAPPHAQVKRYVREHDAAGHVTVAMIDHQFHGSWILDAAVCERVVAGIERLWAAVAAGAAVGPRAAGDEEQEEQQLLEQRGRGRLMSRPFPRLRKGLALLLRRRRAGGRTASVFGKGDGAPGTEAVAAAAVGAY